MKLKVAYFGTPTFSARFLEKCLSDKDLPIDVSFVVTQPDTPVGRKKVMTPSPVKEIVKKYNIPVVESLLQVGDRARGAPTSAQGLSPQDQTVDEHLLGAGRGQAPLGKIDLALVYAYGKIIPSVMLGMPRLGFWNIHPSLLPKYRGPSPTAYPLILGDKITGVTLMQMDEKMDHGPIIDTAEFMIPQDMRRPELEGKLTDLGLELFKKNVAVIASRRRAVKQSQGDRHVANAPRDDIKTTPQNHELATYTKLIHREDGFIPLSVIKKSLRSEIINKNELPPIISRYLAGYPIFNFQFSIFNFWRGLASWPGLWTLVTINGAEKRLKLIDLYLEPSPVVRATLYMLHIRKVQLEGKGEVSFEQFNKVYNIF